VAAAVGVVGALPLAGGLFAVEEQQLDGEGQLLPRLDHTRQFQQRRGAAGAVAGADEAEFPEQLGVEMAGEHDALGALAGDGGDQVDHLDRPDRRGRSPRLLDGLDADRRQRLRDVLAVLDVARRARGPGPDRHLLAQVVPRLGTVERRRRLGRGGR